MKPIDWLVITAFCCGVNLMALLYIVKNGVTIFIGVQVLALVFSVFATYLNYIEVKRNK